MKLRPLMAMLLLLGAADVAQAQLRVKLEREHGTVLQYEAVPLKLAIWNDTEIPVSFGRYAPDARVEITIERRQHQATTIVADFEPFMGAQIAPGASSTLSFDLGKHHKVREQGRYTISARIVWARRSYDAGSLYIDVVNGIELKNVTKSIPYDPSEVRTYSLLYWQRDDSQHLFLRVKNEDQGLVYGVFDLGRVVRTVPPEIEFDTIGRVHIVHLYGREVYTHSYLLSDRSGVWFWKRRFTNQDGTQVRGPGGGHPEGASDDAEAAEDEPEEAAAEAPGESRPKSRYLLRRLWPFGDDE